MPVPDGSVVDLFVKLSRTVTVEEVDRLVRAAAQSMIRYAKSTGAAIILVGHVTKEGALAGPLRNELANQRIGTASTKTRSEVRGSGTKPWRQKGTGRARAGSRQSPVWVGGGVVFGPRPRDYGYRLPRKIKRLAIRSILSQKQQESRLKVVEDFSVESGKTRELVKVLLVRVWVQWALFFFG